MNDKLKINYELFEEYLFFLLLNDMIKCIIHRISMSFKSLTYQFFIFYNKNANIFIKILFSKIILKVKE